ncbi:threonylcarbamoyl-AMP synthase [Candidatus Micrarchaeota archaeon]|nr:threonylcarbamoyl-AMP synthase [Candidatus Micrarchaeota archaeon]
MKKTTEIIKINPKKFKKEQIEWLGQEIKNGKTVVFPTETVYGLGANALDEKAVVKIFQAKGRPSDNPLIIHIAKKKQLNQVAKKASRIAQRLMDKFWPGPLTLILKKKAQINLKVSGGLQTVAVRMPRNKIARELIIASKVPIAAPSANTSGRPSPTQATHAIEDLKGKVDYIIDAGKTQLGLESTVVDTTSKKVKILRHGTITEKEIEAVVGQTIGNNKREGKIHRSPGTRYKHYAPKCQMVIIKGPKNKVFQDIERRTKREEKQGRTVGIICFEKHSHCAQIVEFAGTGNKERGQNIFRILRNFDHKKTDIVFCEAIEEQGIGTAIMDRLKRAANNKIRTIR